MPRLTFESFRKSRRRSTDLSSCVNAPWEITSGACAGFVYLDRFCIKQEPSGTYHLKIGNDEWICDDIEVLELRLYEFAAAHSYASSSLN